MEVVNSSLEKEKLSLFSSVARLEAEINVRFYFLYFNIVLINIQSHRTYMQTLCKDISQTFTDTKSLYPSTILSP